MVSAIRQSVAVVVCQKLVIYFLIGLLRHFLGEIIQLI